MYVDHLPGNFFSRLTLHAYGFCDAADVFVLIAGISAGIAFCATFQQKGWLAGLLRILRRIAQVYATHIMLVSVCAAALWIGAGATGNLDLLLTDAYAFFGGDLTDEVRHTLSLRLQPHYLNILPLYVVLLAALPLIVLVLRIHVAVLVAGSLVLWLLPRTLGWNLPSDLHSPGWFFNPLAWQLLFVLGVVLGQCHWRRYLLPHRRLLALVAAAYCAFALLAVAPWAKIPSLAEWHLLPGDWMGPIDKQHLSLLRVFHVLALAYLVAYLVPASAGWLDHASVRYFRALGRTSLSVFAVAAMLDTLGWIVWREGGQGVACQFALIVAGFAIMGATAVVVEHRALLAALLWQRFFVRGKRSDMPGQLAPRSAS